MINHPKTSTVLNWEIQGLEGTTGVSTNNKQRKRSDSDNTILVKPPYLLKIK